MVYQGETYPSIICLCDDVIVTEDELILVKGADKLPVKGINGYAYYQEWEAETTADRELFVEHMQKILLKLQDDLKE